MKNKFAAIAAGAIVVGGAMPTTFAAEQTTGYSESVSEGVTDNSGKITAPAGGVSESVSQAESKTATIEAGEVKHILISGNKTISKEELMKFVTHTKEGGEYNREETMKDVQAIGESGLVQSVKAKALQNNGVLYVVFEVKELAEVQSISFEGNTIIPTEQLEKLVGTKVGEMFSRETVRQDMELIRNAYAEQGFVAVVGGVNNNDGAVTYSIREAKVGDVIYSGNNKTKDWVMDKLAGKYLKKDSFLRNDNLQAAYNALSNSGYFSGVKIDAQDVPEAPGTVNLLINVKETSTGAWNIGGAYSDTYGAELVGGIYDKNLGGTAKSLALDFGVGTERDHYTLTFTDPYWRKSDTSVYMQAFKTDKQVDNDYFEYTENHTGGEIGFSKPVSRDNRTTMYGKFRVDNVQVDDQQRGYPLGDLQENSVTLGVIHDGRNMATGSGTVLEGSAMSSMKVLGSDEDFTKFMASAKSYKRLSSRDMLAARGVFNYSPDNLPGIEQFTIGGSDTVRGMTEDEQRGNQSVLASLEYRHDFNDKLQGVVFVDAGKAWSDEFDNDLKVATGLGLRVKTALGVLRLDAAKVQGNDMKFLFGIGQSF